MAIEERPIRECAESKESAPQHDEQQRAAELCGELTKRYDLTVKNGIIVPKTQKSILVHTAADITPKEIEWLIPGYIPRGSISTIAGDGGSGKTSAWCNLVAGVTTGKPPFLLGNSDGFDTGPSDPEDVLVLSAEDSWTHTLYQRLKANGADMNRVHYISPSDDGFEDLTFDSDILHSVIMECKPSLVVFDPLQAFIAKGAKMAERNTMRKCMAPLIGLGENYGITSIIIAHANKQSGVWGRKRIADSADIWDASRSVMMVGETQEPGVRYISHEKSNYGKRKKTVLFTLEDCVPTFNTYTDMRDREYVINEVHQRNARPSSDYAKDFILDTLHDHGGQMEVSELDGLSKALGISEHSVKDAKTSLKKEGSIRIWSVGFKPKKYYISLTDLNKTD